MNVPLNIDWQQILLHALNLVILIAGLYLLLFKPVKRFMDERTQKYQSMADDAAEKTRQAQALYADYQNRLKGADAEIQQKHAEGMQKAEADAREVLEDALENFPGTILAISHDRYFINRFATKVCVLEAGGVKEYLGNYDDYFEKINRQQAPDSENAGMTKTAMDKEKRKSREEEKRIREKKNAIAAAEKAIATAEEEAAEMEAQLADPATYQDAEKAAQLAKAYQLKKDEIERRYAEWEALSAEE